jgi:hypothetical protein
VKRGLVALDASPPAELHERVHRLQDDLRGRGVDVALIYGDVHRSGDISYLTNLCVYWNEGVLAVPVAGEPAFLTKLSSRVHPWMRDTSTVEDLRSGPSLARLAADLLAGREPGVLGLVERRWWPADLVDQLAESLPDWTIRDLGPVVRERRLRVSETELDLLRAGGAITGAALAAACEPRLGRLERIGAAERSAREAGVEDVVVHCDELADGGCEVRVATELRGYWTLASRLLPDDGDLRHAVDDLERGLRAGIDPGALAPADDGWRLRLLQHVDVETNGDHLPETEGGNVPEGSVAAAVLERRRPDGSWAALADTYRFGHAGVECLTRARGG